MDPMAGAEAGCCGTGAMASPAFPEEATELKDVPVVKSARSL